MSHPSLYEPIDVLKAVAPEIWIVDGPVVRMAAPFTTRMTIVRLRGGGLWCHSPVAPRNALFAAVDALGPVRHLVSPNKLHYAHIAAWRQRYPQAAAWASPGVRERAAAQGIEVKFDADLEDAVPAAWSDRIEQLHFRGSRAFEEVVFFHHASATLVLADLVENFERTKLIRAMRVLARFGGVLDPNGKTPSDMRMTFTDRRAARACLQQILA